MKSSAWRAQEFQFFWYLLGFWQNIQGKYCQNLRKYHQYQKIKNSRGLELGALKNFHLFDIFSNIGEIFKENLSKSEENSNKSTSINEIIIKF